MFLSVILVTIALCRCHRKKNRTDTSVQLEIGSLSEHNASQLRTQSTATDEVVNTGYTMQEGIYWCACFECVDVLKRVQKLSYRQSYRSPKDERLVTPEIIIQLR